MSERSALLACDLDSQVFGALPLALAFQARGWRVTFAVESARTLPKSLLERLAGQFSVLERSINALPTDDEAFRHAAIGVFVTGSRLALFRHTLEIAARAKRLPRPALFCGFNGLVFEKFEEGVAWRLGYDVIGLNGPRDQDAFVDFVHATDFEQQPSVIVGLRRKTDAPPRPLKIPQSVVPEADEDRANDAADADADAGEDQETDGASNVARSEDVASGAIAETVDEAPPPDSDDVSSDEDRSSETRSSDRAIGDDEKDRSEDDEEPDGDERDPDSENGEGESENGEASTNGEDAANGLSAVPAAARPPKKLFVFAEQVVVPRTLKEREALVATLARLAKASPGWDIALKARVRPEEQTFHSQPNHISKLINAVRSKPRNLFVTYKPLDELLERADLFATISSTALFDAFDYGVPSLVATDFGLRNADGAHVFFASGLLVRLCDLESLDDAPIHGPDERWVRRMGYGEPYSPAALIDWLEAFDPAQPMPPSFVSFEAAAGVAAGSPQRASAICKAYARTSDALEELEAEERMLAAGAAETRATDDDALAADDPALAEVSPTVEDPLPVEESELAKEPTTPRVPPAAEPPVAASVPVAVTAPVAPSRPLPNPNAELAMLGFAITAALASKAPPSSSPRPPGAAKASAKGGARKYEGPVEAFSRKLGMYWLVKRTRLRLGLPIYAPRD
ncbi:DUF6716 putative glycosyltransferase [Hansschlegelia zhihuaiae]|uniref:Uncharacterized protein n=1 Tax=Hansschlegelia zhihuaiae TaxID=405005 RepID=A0A4Q0MP32_9HYPH|nr:DUF6716 putative glycosyltransferase [Hansschlegelia zhihuaiae]RXF75413.1 hypothetical protein EK403_00720 [Hansschlegelia zhihuaiae]